MKIPKSKIQEALELLKKEVEALPGTWTEEQAREMVNLWNGAIPFGARPEYIFFQNYDEIPDPEIARRIYLVCEWYKLWTRGLETPRGKALEILLREFSRTHDLIE